MDVAVGRLHMTVRWNTSEKRHNRATETQLDVNRAERAYRRAQLARQIEADRERCWERKGRANLWP